MMPNSGNRGVHVALAVASIACLIALAACSATQRNLPVNQALADIGLPVYPGATPTTKYGGEQSSRSLIGSMKSTVIMLSTPDSLDRVKSFYEARLPKVKREVVLPLGRFSTITMQFFVKNKQKQVTIIHIGGETAIELGSTAFGALIPTPEPSR
jgi:hypothetical protein